MNNNDKIQILLLNLTVILHLSLMLYLNKTLEADRYTRQTHRD